MKEFKPEVFVTWIKEKFFEFQNGNTRIKVADFARHLDQNYTTVSYWILGKITQRPNDDQCNSLIEKFGFEAYEPLALQPPLEEELFSLLPSDEANRLKSALEEIRSSDLYKGNAKTSPDDVKRIKEVFSKYGVNISDNRS